MNVAVVGGSGFIGSHVMDALVKANHIVTDFDIMPPENPRVRHIYLDILDPSKAIIALAGEYGAVFMLAAMANVGDVFRNPTQAVEVNVVGTANILEAARRHDIPRLVLASTVWVYSGADIDLCTEETPIRIDVTDHVYTATKIASELLVYSYAKLYGIGFTVLRYGIPYGPRARSGSAITEFVRRASNGEPIVIQGDGKQQRRFLYVEDLAQANVLALSPVAKNKTYNVEGPELVSILQIAEMVNAILGPVEIKFSSARIGDYKTRTASNDRIEADLHWQPRTPFASGLHKYIDWYRRAHASGR